MYSGCYHEAILYSSQGQLHDAFSGACRHRDTFPRMVPAALGHAFEQCLQLPCSPANAAMHLDRALTGLLLPTPLLQPWLNALQ